jgi:hypothetical protein
VEPKTRAFIRRLGRIPAGWWVVLLTLPALAPLARPGFYLADDGTFHIQRLAALDRAVRAGALYPRWFPELAFGYGHPVLNFYGPLNYYWGLPVTLLGADAALALQLVLATGLVASALSMYLFARLHLERGPALVASAVYAYLPYHLVDLYVRGAMAELLAFVWFPLVLWAFHQLVEGRNRGRLYQVGMASLLLVALLVTHSLSGLIFAPVLASYSVILLVRMADRRAIARVVAALALAMAASAFYWLPVLIESRYVGLGHGVSQGYQDHLLTWGRLFAWDLAYPYPTDAGVARVFPLGLVQVLILAASLLIAFQARPQRWVILLFLVVALISGFMLTTSSLPVWRLLERGIALLQYPWRFQTLLVLATAFLAGALVQGLTRPTSWNRLAVASLIIVVTGVWALARLSIVPESPDPSIEAMWQMDRDHGQVGTTWTGEYLPIWVSEQRWALSHPVGQPVPGGTTLPPGQFKLTGVGHTRFKVDYVADQDTSLVLHQFYYPGWRAVSQGGHGSYDGRAAGVLGLAAFELPPGSDVLMVRLEHTPSQRWGTLISLVVSLAMAMGIGIRSRRPVAGSRIVPLVLAASYLLLAVVLVASLLWPNGTLRNTLQVNANLEDTVELLAFSPSLTAYSPGDRVEVTLYWRALGKLDRDYKAFVHMTDAAVTYQPAQHDGDPGGGFSPTTRWLAGELVPDSHRLELPSDLTPGNYLLWAGMYEYDTVRNLEIVAAEVPTSGNRVLLGEIEVTAP